jgi:predicted short-subunit dehydrogenase-like oxidoreductase (DUF2520 family)
MSDVVSIAVIGKGRVGSSLAKRIEKNGSRYKLFAHAAARSKSFGVLKENGGPEVIFIVSKDDEIVRVAKKALKSAGKNLKLLVHCAGSRSSEILPYRKKVARLTLHPLQTFAEADASLLKNIYYMASTKDIYAKKWAKKFVQDIGGGNIIFIAIKDLPLYHLLTVFAANFTTLIGGAIEIFSKSLRLSPAKMKKAVAPLMQKSLENVLENDAAKVLTGPLARKDYSTILKHRIALQSQPVAFRKIYEGFVLLAELLK